MWTSWWFISLFTSFLTAGYITLNQFYQLKGSLLMIYRGIFMAVLLAPFALFFPPLPYWEFYAVCFIQGLLVAYVDNRFFNAVKIYGAEVTSIFQPLSVSLIFVCWFLLHPGQLADFLHQPVKFVFILLCLLGISLSVAFFRRVKTNRAAFSFMFITLMCLVFIDIFNKTAMGFGGQYLLSAIYYYTLINAVVSGICNLAVFLYNHEPWAPVWKPRNLGYAAIVIVFNLFGGILKNFALFQAPNPAYVSAILYCYPVWLVLGTNIWAARSRHLRRYTRIKLPQLLLLVTSVIGLILIAG